MTKNRLPRRDLDNIEANVRSLKRRKVPGVQSFSRKHLREIMRYTKEYDPETWEKIARTKGVLSYSLLLHEWVQLGYIKKKGVDPLDAEQRALYYLEAHARALWVEHSFLHKLAQIHLPRAKITLGTLVALNPTVTPETAREDLVIIKRYWPEEEAQSDVGVDVVLDFYASL